MSALRIAVVDDQDLVRAGFVGLLGAEPDLEVVAEASNGDEAIRVVRSTIPDVVLMDVRMPALDGIEATRRITTDPAPSTSRTWRSSRDRLEGAGTRALDTA